jgi:hypothetical protein
LVDPRSGSVTPVWRAFLTALWQNQGGLSSYTAARVNGNPNQAFQVGVATTNEEAVPLAQADERYAAIAGSQLQSFAVGNAPAGTNQAIRRSQVEALFVAFAGAGAPIVPVTVGASPFAYTVATGGALALSGGTVSAVTLTRGSTTVPVSPTSIPARNGDVITITYTAAPTVNFIPA